MPTFDEMMWRMWDDDASAVTHTNASNAEPITIEKLAKIKAELDHQFPPAQMLEYLVMWDRARDELIRTSPPTKPEHGTVLKFYGIPIYGPSEYFIRTGKNLPLDAAYRMVFADGHHQDVAFPTKPDISRTIAQK